MAEEFLSFGFLHPYAPCRNESVRARSTTVNMYVNSAAGSNGQSL